MKRSLVLLTALTLVSSLVACKHKQEVKKKEPPPLPPVDTVALPPSEKPTVAVRLMFRAGSIDDPPGKEGLTALCARLMAQGGTASLSASELPAKLFPLAADVTAHSDREETVFTARVHKDFQGRVLPILADVVTAPRLDPKEFERLRADAVNDITQNLRANADEDLSRQALINFIFAGHPYSQYVGGTVAGLKAITLDDVKKHIARVFTLDRLTVGIAGGYDPKQLDALKKTLATRLPPKGAPAVTLPQPPTQIRGRIVEKDTETTAIFLGYPWEVKRSDPDYYALAAGISALGEHRQTTGRLFHELRERRGLNYGDYAYVEHFEQDGWGTYPAPNVGLHQQYFGLWVRSVETPNRAFAVKAAFYVVKKLADEGVSQDELDRTKGFLQAYTRMWELSEERKLGFALDEKFYGTPNFLQGYRDALDKMTLDQVNAALKKHIDVGQLHLVMVTKGAEAAQTEITSGNPTPPAYANPKNKEGAKPKDVTAEDKLIEKFPLGLKASDIQLIKTSDLFEK